MRRARTPAKHERETSTERSVADFLPYSSHVSREAIATYDGDLLRTWRVEGIPYETADEEEVHARKEQLHGTLRSIASPHVAIWQHTIRRRVDEELESCFDEPFCAALDTAYRESMTDYGMMRTEHYVTLVYRPEPTRAGRLFARAGRRREALATERRESLQSLDEIAGRLEAALASYTPEPLTTYTGRSGALCSHLLSLLSMLVSGQWREIRVPRAPISDTIASAWIFAGTETIEVRLPTTTRYARCLDISDYPDRTTPGMLDALLYSDCEFVLTQSFSFVGKQKAREQLQRHKTQLSNVGDDSPTELAGITQALDELTQGLFVMGEYHFALMLYGDSVDEVRGHAAKMTAEIEEQGFVVTLASTALDAAWYAQMPGNWIYRPRVEFLTSRNFASLAPLHGFITGKRDGNAWGQALTMFQTPSGAPLYYSLHLEGVDDDEFGKRPLGNARVIGTSGVGKTVLLNFLAAQAHRFATEPMTMVFFDKDRGARLFVEAIGGKYHEIKSGTPTGFNPFQLEPTPENVLFLERLVATLATRAGASISVDDETRISNAVAAVMRMHPIDRRLSTLLENMTEARTDRENSVLRRLARWCTDDGQGRSGALAWVLDNETDSVDLSTHRVYGFDGTSFLDGDPDVRTAVSMYLLHRIEQAMDGRRFIYWMDEAGRWINDTPFTAFAGTKQTDIRKRNGLGVFATQMPSQLLESSIARALVEQVATEIYLPNPRADADEYMRGFGLTATEYRTVLELPEHSRTFLLKQRFRQGRRSVIARLDLAGFDEELAVLSGTTENNELADQVIDEVGDDLATWLPLFHQRRRARDAAARPSRGFPHEDPTGSRSSAALLQLDRRRPDPDHGRGGDQRTGGRTPRDAPEVAGAVRADGVADHADA